jgi:S-DNA-T family DNA segregation ATPase FtsK/SpoIIIE
MNKKNSSESVVSPGDDSAKSNPIDSHHGLGLLTPSRQRLFLRGVTNRYGQATAKRKSLADVHRRDMDHLEARLAETHAVVAARCRDDRRSFLIRWDDLDEQTIARYESGTMEVRNKKNRELAVLRRERKKAVANEEQAYDDATAKVTEQYKIDRPKIEALHKRETDQLRRLLARVAKPVQQGRELTLHRMGGPEKMASLIASPASNDVAPQDETEIKSLADCNAHLESLGQQAESIDQQLNSGIPVRINESYYLVLVVLAAMLGWCGIVFALAPERFALWMLLCLPWAFLVGVVTHTVCAIPIRAKTRTLYPQLEKIFGRAEAIAGEGQRRSAAKATEKTNELRRQRDAHLEQLRSDHEQEMANLKEDFRQRETTLISEFDRQLNELESTFGTNFKRQTQEMQSTGQSETARLTEMLEQSKTVADARRDALNRNQVEEIKRLQKRLEEGISRAFSRARRAHQAINQQFPRWADVTEIDHDQQPRPLRWLPLGEFAVDTRLSQVADVSTESVPEYLPLVLPRETHSGLLIDCPAEMMQTASDWVSGILWRSMTAVAPGFARLTLLDPVGRGQNFATLVGLGDHDPLLIGHRAWSASAQISARLSELTQHVEDVLQTCLRDRYRTIEDYNRDAGALAEPYRIVAAIGFPAGLNRESIEALRALIEGGRRCGVFTIIVRDNSQAWPSELPELPEARLLRMKIDADGEIRHLDPVMSDLKFLPVQAPPSQRIPELTDKIGRAALALNRVVIPLEDLVPPEHWDAEQSASGLTIPVGRQGVGRSLDIRLGSGMRQHMLVAGKTGSGKSTLLHALIMSAALRYSPEELQLYLLDFKKGVEFKIYADESLPHAKVIGIESEREFGLSVLQRLDEELQQRGELFRAAGVQEVSEYRRGNDTRLARILLVVDEFQELFTQDDRVAQQCTMLLDRLVRQGRSFGIHVVLSSQSLAGAYTLPRATLGQMAIRIALQCNEADAAMILADDNTAARLLSRPGEAIFNDAGGLIEGNQPFQVAWIAPDKQRQQIAAMADRHQHFSQQHEPPVVFEGNRPSKWTPALASSALGLAAGSHHGCGLLGEAVRIGPPTMLKLTDNAGRNVLCVAGAEAVQSTFATWLPIAYKEISTRMNQTPRVIVFEGRQGDDQEFSFSRWLAAVGIDCEIVRPRDAAAMISGIAGALASANGEDETAVSPPSPTFLFVTELERFRELRQDETFGFSLDATAEPSGAASFQKVLADGPASGVHSWIGCGGFESLTRWLPRSSHHDLELRIVGRVSANDSAQLIDTPDAANLSTASMYLYDDGDGRLEKFRLCDIPDAARIAKWLRS